MLSLNVVLLLIGLLILIGSLSSKFSARVGMPVLVLFMVVGMVAGSEGLFGIEFEDYEFANSIASVALALILFDGGLRTTAASFKASNLAQCSDLVQRVPTAWLHRKKSIQALPKVQELIERAEVIA